MKDFKLKLILTVLTGVVFSFIFILLAFVLPTTKKDLVIKKEPQNLLEQVSQSIKK
ncbi:MAG: hypothetical protein OQK48_04890 [Sulfurimonas sp.]|nr:hypothetical protein [Sulfurimonas sp.]